MENVQTDSNHARETANINETRSLATAEIARDEDDVDLDVNDMCTVH